MTELRSKVSVVIEVQAGDEGYSTVSGRTQWLDEDSAAERIELGNVLAEAVCGYDPWMGFNALAHAVDFYPEVAPQSMWPHGDDQLDAAINDLIEAARRFNSVYGKHIAPRKVSPDAAAH